MCRWLQRSSRDAFAGPPWGEDWNDAQRLTQYVREGMDGENALAFGLADGEGLAAVALGHVRHWHNRVEYILEDFCVCQRCQGQGSGAELMTAVKNACRDLAIDEIVCARGATLAPIISTKNRIHRAEKERVFYAKL